MVMIRREAQDDFYPHQGLGAQEVRLPAPVGHHARAQSVHSALRECAGIPAREFALFVVDDQGTERQYTSASIARYQPTLFDERFRAEFRNVIAGNSEDVGIRYGYASRPGTFDVASRDGMGWGDQRRKFSRQTRSGDSDDEAPRVRKRSRPALYGQLVEDSSPVIQPQRFQQLLIGNDDEVEKFYFQRFRDMQQSACKVIGKSFVKLVEPKKQTHYPYTKGDCQAPPWWPRDGSSKMVRHKEPDHLLKPERVRLLVHILLMIVEPYPKQHPSVQKLGLNVQRLHEATLEVMGPWFNDKEHPENAAKAVYFKEVFKVAKQQERYKDGEIDATTKINVMSGENRPGLDLSDDDDEDEDIKGESEVHQPTSTAMVSTPDSIVSPTMMQHPQMHSEADSGFPSRNMPMRFNSGQIEPQFNDVSYQPRTLSFQPTSPTAQDLSRRSFASSSSYQSPQPQQNMYSWGHPNNMASNGPNTSFYVASSHSLPQTPQFQLPPPTSAAQPMPMLPPPPIIAHHYELPTVSRFEPNPNTGIPQLRTHNLAHGLPDYYQDNNGYGNNDSEHQG
ncbi:hypothetical protein BJ878DRAFT_62171 [Calycina marina]|uniref:Subtelomeric hrmA-associated cluster protein AFUB-079030/YDR124W-like helical bundle domain-containing protein n=1 Tax=Calycina marina TaxID=1763456 RepID=A0A9P8CIT6_9HELO|nr:hypothetical protein BJ878DRAFT_62171 [Calycina marina]